MTNIINISLIAVILVFLVVGIKRGFIKELVSLIGFIVAFITALFLSGIGSSFVYDTFVDGFVQEKVSSAVVQSVDNEVDGVLVSIPEYFINAAEATGTDIEGVVKSNIGASVEETANSVAATVSKEIAKPVIGALIRVILFIIIFIIVKILIDWIGRALDLVGRLPVIHSLNRVFGAVIGTARGIVIAAIMCFVAMYLIKFQGGNLFGLTAEMLESSFVYNLLSSLF